MQEMGPSVEQSHRAYAFSLLFSCDALSCQLTVGTIVRCTLAASAAWSELRLISACVFPESLGFLGRREPRNAFH